jgi:hypothetical protein
MLLRDGFSFTVLQPELMYSNNTHHFFPEVGLVQGLRYTISEKLTQAGSGILLENGTEMAAFKPEFFIRLTRTGLEVGIVLDRPASLRDREWKAVATLPLEVFWSLSGAESFKTYSRRQRLLLESGWKQEVELGLCYKHRYVDVWPREFA